MPGFLKGPVTGFVDRMKGKGLASKSFLQQIGSSAAQSAGGGCLAFGGAASNGADTTADTLFTATLPANLLDIVGRCITLQIAGTVTATSSTAKIVNFVWGGGSLSQQIVSYGTVNSGSWQAYITIVKTGSNTQAALFQGDATGTVTLLGSSVTRNVVVNASGTETDTAAITLIVTGQSTSAGTAGLVNLTFAILDGYN